MSLFRIEKDKLKLWSFVCILSAAPSFYWALRVKADIPAIIIGVLLFILAYTIATSGNFYKKLQEKIFLFKALRWGFRVRIFYSLIALPSIFVENVAFWVNIADCCFGLLSIIITQFFLGKESMKLQSDETLETAKAFLPTLLTTITQGILLSLAVFAISLIFWLFFRIKFAIMRDNVKKY